MRVVVEFPKFTPAFPTDFQSRFVSILDNFLPSLSGFGVFLIGFPVGLLLFICYFVALYLTEFSRSHYSINELDLLSDYNTLGGD